MDDGLDFGDILQIIIYSVIAIIGTLARELKTKDVTKLKVAKLFSNLTVAAFGSMMVYFVADMLGLPSQMGYILAGMIGWFGNTMIDSLFEKAAKEYLPKKKR